MEKTTKVYLTFILIPLCAAAYFAWPLGPGAIQDPIFKKLFFALSFLTALPAAPKRLNSAV